ncbi:hypothetical protein J4573_16635 [Actinomadura barringtoniae]|uniref:Uncharacterized protein n=1 Tax=Actinomadura barringtoniae TaxID=1427535 RepID=A0A939T216_9ACTN|nr:hypothetical protein [Actinomadura barringtoniae]MBO2448731.1 hypothetical protein [Actinomadura barringtoniae]
MTESDQPGQAKTGLTLLDDSTLYVRMTTLMAERGAVDSEKASRIIGQAVVLAHYALTHLNVALSPSSDVARGVEAFVLHSADWEIFSIRYGGGRNRLYHVPCLPGKVDRNAPSGATVVGPSESRLVLSSAGYLTDPDLWPLHETTPRSYLFSQACCNHHEAPFTESLAVRPQAGSTNEPGGASPAPAA